MDFRLMDLEAEYACFNSRRSLSRVEIGHPSWERVGENIYIQNPDWLENSYVNRICTTENGIVHTQIVPGLKRIDVFSDNKLTGQLSEITGFKQSEDLHFYQNNLKEEFIPPSTNSEIKIRLCQDPDFFLSEIGRSIGKKISAEILDAKRNLYCSDEFKCYLALVDTHVAGLATLYVSGNTGWFANAYTYEPYRKQGIQSALLYRRLKDSQDLGLISVFTDVEAGSASERNIERFSFKFAAACSAWEAIP